MTDTACPIRLLTSSSRFWLVISKFRDCGIEIGITGVGLGSGFWDIITARLMRLITWSWSDLTWSSRLILYLKRRRQRKHFSGREKATSFISLPKFFQKTFINLKVVSEWSNFRFFVPNFILLMIQRFIMLAIYSIIYW